MSEVGILNVGAGDTKISFDKSNPAERERAKRIVKDMIRRGYALLIEVDDGKGGKTHVRAHDFDEETCEYIIADFDSAVAVEVDRADAEASAAQPSGGKPARKPRKGTATRVPAERARGVSVGRSAGG